MNPEKSNFVPAQRVHYLGTVLDAQTFRASLSQVHIDRLLSLGDEFLSSRLQPASTWLALLGTLSSFSHLVPGGRLRMRALHLALHRSWDRLDDSFLVSWSDDCLQDLLWWMDPDCLHRRVSLSQLSPNLDIWSDASNVGWGAHLGPEVISGLWSPEEARLSINIVDFGAGSSPLSLSVSHSTVTVFADNSMAMAYLRNAGGTCSPALNSIAQRILVWPELHHVRLAPQFIMGCHSVLADSLSLSSGPDPGV